MHELELKSVESSSETDQDAVEGTVPQQTGPVISETDMVVDTPYGLLKYPKKWSDQIRIEQGTATPLTVSFYAKIGEHEEAFLFSVLFDATEGLFIGAVANNEGDLASVSLVFGELSNSNEWKDAEQDAFYAMQEDANYLVEQLELVVPVE